ncbi:MULTISPECIES: pentapeptide repeat-containing protein [Niastella]|uniref:Pentapeptide repeat-containing protein n=1 Tax=Niastella soli TaxID=2821487 RepID=A0ABS3YV24_9BACT|nr:pentapeptide repeat-containing protein [Niastella soli]MBO9201728.1 pentapeptide repeat-containing protein [Niastella soli]
MKDYSNQNLQNASFVDQDLRFSNFSNSDLRGANFSGANLNGVDFTGIKTGITPVKLAWMFLVSMIISLFSGYLAMLGGRTIQALLYSKVEHERTAGILALVVTVIFIICAWYVGGGHAIRSLLVPIIIFAFLAGIILYWSGLSTGKGMFYLGLSLVLIVVLFVAGTIARTMAGVLSNILFFVVAISGTIFGKSVGGDIGTVVLAFICAIISKRAINNVHGFFLLNGIALYITGRYGTSFRRSKMANTRFAQSKLRNADFSNTDISSINWGNAKRVNCIIDNRIITD